MSWFSLAAIYFVVWWLMLFVVLPIGVRTQRDAGEVEEGTEPGAPVRPQIFKKMIATTILSAVVLAAYVWIRSSGFGLDDIPFLPEF